jgi:hypothetical protein
MIDDIIFCSTVGPLMSLYFHVKGRTNRTEKKSIIHIPTLKYILMYVGATIIMMLRFGRSPTSPREVIGITHRPPHCRPTILWTMTIDPGVDREARPTTDDKPLGDAGGRR